MSFDLWARAGGSGGGGGGGGDSSGGGSSNYGGSRQSYGSPYGSGDYAGGEGSSVGFFIAFVFIVLIYLFIQAANKRRQASGTGQPVAPELRRKIETAFMTVQQAWSEQNLSLMRRFISDGVYQRFNAQFTMMRLLGQRNQMSNIRIYSIEQIPKSDDPTSVYESIDIRIDASADDQFVCAQYPELNSPGGNERFVEYWSFIRRRDHKVGKDIYGSDRCPQCEAPLAQKLIEDARCSYCSSYLNNGEFDWVLSEITQEGDYSQSRPALSIMGASSADPGFSVQVLEDKASNAFTQILIATATADAKALRRFTTDDVFEKLKLSVSESRIIYNRMYINSVVTQQVSQQNGLFSAMVLIRYTSSQVVDGRLGNETTYEQTIKMVHRPSGNIAKGSIYANACPTCGAPQKDSLSHVCTYCSAAMNDITREWLVGGFA